MHYGVPVSDGISIALPLAQSSISHQDQHQKEASDQVEYTISQDRAAGNSAQEESDIKLLTGKKFDVVGLPASLAKSKSNLALQDYQMQLMRLEQQNKKLMMKRQERDTVLKPSGNPVREFAQAGESRKRKRAKLEEVNSNSEHDSDDGGRNEGQDIEKNPSSAEQNQTRSSKSNTRVNSPNTLQGQHDESVEGDTNPNTESNTSQPAASSYCILYRVFCSVGHGSCHLRTYLDEPRRLRIASVHLAGNTLVPDLGNFLHGHKEAAFIIYREYYCENGIPSSPSSPYGSSPETGYYREIFDILSGDLHAIIQRRSKFAPDQDAYGLEGNELDASTLSPALSFTDFEYSDRFLYHHRKELSEEAATATEGSAIRALNSYIMGNPSNMYTKCDHLFSQRLVSHDTLSWLFYPNDVLVTLKDPLEIAYVLRRFPEEGSRLQLNCWNWGHGLRRMDTSVSVDVPKSGTVPINKLAMYPLRFATEETKERLLDNGKQFLSLRKQSFVSYEGPDYKGERIYPSDSRFLLDHQTNYKSKASNSSSKIRAAYDQWPEDISNRSSLHPNEMMLFPPDIHGFSMKEKKCVQLLVAQIQPVNWNKAAFDRLVLPKRTKNLIKALVMVRKPTPENSGVQTGLNRKRDDIIAGKGSGLSMLLHGGPGTGKTLTAELAEMPLFSVTCGDIGTSPEAIYKNLHAALHYVRKWNCVLLLDEADFFLEERSLLDLEGNNLVSTFLRALEHYDGILILTSNRVGTFDKAFKSRIQLALHYPTLDAPSRRKIWRNFLDILNADDENININDIVAHMDKLSSYEMNGRQIRNALTTARQLALFEQETLDWDRIKDSIEVAGDFNRYLVEVHGHTEEQ
ncbi:hypothetical protein F5Y12DRAFT_709612 [Xylaria sp. FL1777]|nr:hypothetical protein F5Y12DRAFT_709612 [Xylaria sp. FL1777]